VSCDFEVGTDVSCEESTVSLCRGLIFVKMNFDILLLMLNLLLIHILQVVVFGEDAVLR